MKQIVAILSFSIFACGAKGAALSSSSDDFFELKIRPRLMEACVKCHGGEKISNGLRLDAREHLLKGGERGAALIPGDPENSLLMRALRREHEDYSMPPKKALSAAAVEDFRKWIEAGAPWPAHLAGAGKEGEGRHWAFQPVRKVSPPNEPDALSPHPIDQFIRARQKELGLRPVAPADRRALIRRASYDLAGLPPTPSRVKAFLANDRPNAFAELVDEALASPRYGERWGRHWLDLARYADTAGENSDYPIPQAYLYRNYVIDSFNEDKPYDLFLKEQIAGDILGRKGAPEDYAERLIATGFLAQAKRFGTGDLEDMHLIIEDTLNTLGQVAMGLGLRCARCHDHKYDPTTMKDYYALYGFFQSAAYPFPGGESVRVPKYFAPTIHPDILAKEDAAYFAVHGDERKRLTASLESTTKHGVEAVLYAKVTRELKALNSELDDCEANTEAARALTERIVAKTGEQKAAKAALDKAVGAIQSKLDEIENGSPSGRAPLAYAVRQGKPADAHIQKLGNPRSRGPVVKRAAPAFLSPKGPMDIPEGESGRLALAEWLTDAENPLTARVMVNRIWQFHFGRPIVATPSNFGIQGEAPTHPELLDWLAGQFIESGWSIKAMHRLIMSSQTYQLSAAHDAGNAALDSDNAYYWRFDRRRLDAESIRDSMLALGGNLDLAQPGPHPFPPVNKWRFSAHYQFKAVYPSNHRSVYLMVQRLHPHPFLSLFNGPDTSASTARRDESVAPMQALFMSNSELVEKQAEGFARALIATESDARRRIDAAYWRAFSRAANAAEIKRAEAYLRRYAELLAKEGVGADGRELKSWGSFARTLLTANEFVFVD